MSELIDNVRTMQCMEVWGGNLPVDTAVVMNGLDAWVFSKPYQNADGGGDVYYVSACATGRILRLLIADVSGHGSAVKDLAQSLRGLMRKYVNFLDQSRFVELMNDQFTALSSEGKFATAIVTTFFTDSGHLTLCNAGHPPPLIYRAKTGSWSYLHDAAARSHLPLGIVDMQSYDDFEIRLDPNDLILCYTDALTEARLPDGELLGNEGLLATLAGIQPVNPARLTRQLIDAVATKAGTAVLEDDLTVLLFRINRRPIKLAARLMSPWRVMSGIFKDLASGSTRFALPDLRLANVGGALVAPLGRRWRGRRKKDENFIAPSINGPGVANDKNVSY